MKTTATNRLMVNAMAWSAAASDGDRTQAAAFKVCETVARLAVDRGVDLRIDGGVVVIDETRGTEISSCTSHGPLAVVTGWESSTRERAAEIVRMALEATACHPEWDALFLATMRGVCE